MAIFRTSQESSPTTLTFYWKFPRLIQILEKLWRSSEERLAITYYIFGFCVFSVNHGRSIFSSIHQFVLQEGQNTQMLPKWNRILFENPTLDRWHSNCLKPNGTQFATLLVSVFTQTCMRLNTNSWHINLIQSKLLNNCLKMYAALNQSYLW